MTTRLFTVLAAVLLPLVPAQEADVPHQPRVWTNTAGKTITAAFVRFNAAGRKVSLKLEKGRQVELPLANLSGNDVDWIKEHVPEAMSNQERMQRHTEGRLGKITKIPATDSYPEAFVYYPSTLKAKTPPPVIILFNSVGNGQHMVQKFRKACEANGWVALGLSLIHI